MAKAKSQEPVTLGELVREYRERTHLSMGAFAIRCGLSKAYISMLENNARPDSKKPPAPSIQAIVSVAAAMEMDVNDVLARMGTEVRDKRQELEQATAVPLSTAQAYLAPFTHIPITKDTILPAIREGRVLILPFKAPKLGDLVYVPMQAFDMAVAHTVHEVDGGIYTASSEAGGEITFSIFDIGHAVFMTVQEANEAKSRWHFIR